MNNTDKKYINMAIRTAEGSQNERDGRVHPQVGAVVVKGDKVLATAHRGERSPKHGNHAEYIALEQKLKKKNLDVAGSTVFTTLEPCTTRKHPNLPCANWIIARGVKRVVIGMLDPNALICGRGIRCLRKAGIEVELFPVKFMKAVESQNRDFTRDQEANNNRLERSLNNSVTIQTGEAVLESWKHHLHAAKRNLVCCGTSLINVSGQIDSIVQKLKSISDFTADFYLLSPANSSGLIDTYITTTQEDEFMTHLRKTYTSLLSLCVQFPGRVNVYLYHDILPFFSCVLFDQDADDTIMILRLYISGKYPTVCPSMTLDSKHSTDASLIKSHVDALDFLRKNSHRLDVNTSASKYWNDRATPFDNLSWVGHKKMLDQIVGLAEIDSASEVLEIGCGTGVLGKRLGAQVGSYIGIDISPEMIRIANEKQAPNTFHMYADALDLRHFKHCRFDAVFARMILHHLTHDAHKCIEECYRVLKKGGRFVVCENVALTRVVEEFQKQCLKLKEDRLTFRADTLSKLIKSAGFKIVRTEETVLSVRLSNWLENNNLDIRRAEGIKKMFENMTSKVRDGLRCKRVENDWLFETKFFMLSAEKNDGELR